MIANINKMGALRLHTHKTYSCFANITTHSTINHGAFRIAFSFASYSKSYPICALSYFNYWNICLIFIGVTHFSLSLTISYYSNSVMASRVTHYILNYILALSMLYTPI